MTNITKLIIKEYRRCRGLKSIANQVEYEDAIKVRKIEEEHEKKLEFLQKLNEAYVLNEKNNQFAQKR